MDNRPVSYSRHRFPAVVISYAVWLYYRFCLSYRDVEELLAQRGIAVSYETIRRWCHKFGQSYANQLKRRFARAVALPNLEPDHPCICSCLIVDELLARCFSLN